MSHELDVRALFLQLLGRPGKRRRNPRGDVRDISAALWRALPRSGRKVIQDRDSARLAPPGHKNVERPEVDEHDEIGAASFNLPERSWKRLESQFWKSP